MKPLYFLFIFLYSQMPALAGETIHFVALAGIKPGKEVQYDTFIDQVIPIWKRHGMTVIARARTVTGRKFKREGPIDIAILRVESRKGFFKYSNDPEYKRIQLTRLKSVDLLTIFDGKAKVTAALLDESPLLRFQFFLNTDAKGPKTLPDGGLLIDVDIVGQVKGRIEADLDKTMAIKIDAIGNKDDGNAAANTTSWRVISGQRLR